VTREFRSFGHKWALYCVFFTAHARNCRISTSGLKSDVTIVFLDPDFHQDAKVSAIRVRLRQIYFYLIFAWVFRTSCPKMGVFGGKIGEGVVRYWPSTNSFLLFGVLTSVPIVVKIDQEMRPWECSQTDRHTHTHPHTHRHTDANRFYNLSHAICYSYGADNKIPGQRVRA